jgi:hypothetical protein
VEGEGDEVGDVETGGVARCEEFGGFLLRFRSWTRF